MFLFFVSNGEWWLFLFSVSSGKWMLVFFGGVSDGVVVLALGDGCILAVVLLYVRLLVVGGGCGVWSTLYLRKYWSGGVEFVVVGIVGMSCMMSVVFISMLFMLFGFGVWFGVEFVYCKIFDKVLYVSFCL